MESVQIFLTSKLADKIFTNPVTLFQGFNLFNGKNTASLKNQISQRTRKRTRKTFFEFKGQELFFSPKGEVFATMNAEFWNKTGLCFWTVQELVLRHKAGRIGRWAKGHSHYEWCF